MKRAIFTVAVVLIASAAFAQESAVIDVQVTNLDVVVTDAKGKRVTGLTASDFEVLEDGKRVEVTNLSEIDRERLAVNQATQPAPRRILIVVDNGTIALSARRKVFDATRAALDRLMIGPSDRVAITTISRSGTNRLSWSADRAQVLQMLAAIEKDAILPNPDLLAFDRSLDAILDEANSAAMSRTGTITVGTPTDPEEGEGANRKALLRERPQVDFQQIVAQARNYASSATSDTRATLSALNAALGSFAEVPGGRKIVILTGGGLPLNSAEAVMQRIESVRNELERTGHLGVRGVNTASMLTQLSQYDLAPQFDEVAAAAKVKGVAIYSVNPEFGERMASSARSSRSADLESEFATMKGMLDGYQRLALATGGAAMIGRPADRAVNEIVSDLDSYYSLGYRSTGPLTPTSQITVKVKKGLTARATIASGVISRDSEVADQVLANHIAEPENPLNFAVVLEEPIEAAGKKTIPMKIMIPVDSLQLLEDNGEYAAAFAVFVSLGNAAGDGSDPVRQQQFFRWPESAIKEVRGKTIGFTVNVEVSGERNRDRISIGVLDRHSGQAGYTLIMLE
ncbi:MAG TPA: VWA domain-containing protein [Thermoanaerobaculia bacterium]|nr:VWA domain-containing protein [Thermoanaerobaculia bacterium]